MKRLLVIGATGGVGRKVCELGLSRGLEVTALARAPEKLASLEPALRVLGGDPLDPHFLAASLGDCEGIVSALGARGLGPTTVHTDGAKALVTALAGRGAGRRVVMVSAAMLFEDAGVLAALLRTTVLRHVARDSGAAEDVLAASALASTVVRPPRLTEGPRTGRWSVAEGRLPPGASGAISRADLADCLLREAARVVASRRLVGVGCSQKSEPASPLMPWD